MTSGSKSKNRFEVPGIVRVMWVLDLTACVYAVHWQFFEPPMLSQMTSKECDALLDMIIAGERQSAYEKVLDDNMTRIQNEVDSIIAAELFRLNNITQSDDPRITDPFHGL